MQRAGKGSILLRIRFAFSNTPSKWTARTIFYQPVMRGRWLRVMVMLWIVAGGSEAQARLLNIGGSLNINYNRSTSFSKTDLGSTSSTINSFGQQYNVGLFGDFYQLGNYRADVTWMDQVVTLVDVDQKNHFNVMDYRLSMGLFPLWSPLNLSRDQVIRKTDLEIAGLSTTTRDRVDSMGANWVINSARLPRTVLNYQQSELKPDTGNKFTTRSASAYTDTTLGATRVAAGYQFNESDTAGSPSTTSHGINLDANSQLTTSLFFNAFGRYTSMHLSNNLPVSSQTTTGASAPGFSFFQERSFGTSLIYRPPLYWWDGLVSYNYSENPFFNDFKSQSVQGAANLRYDEKTDSAFGARYLNISLTDSTINSESADASLNYRPIFGLSTGLGGSTGLTSTQNSSAQNTDSLFQQYRYNINYSRPWQLVQYRANYQITYGVSDTQPTGFNSRDLGNSVSLGLDNTNTQIVHVGLSTTYSDIQRIADSVKTEQSTYIVQLSADSSYFNELIIGGDRMALRAAASYSDTSGFGVEGKTESGDLAANYSTVIGLSVSAAYRIEDYPKELLLDRQTFTVQAQYVAYLISNMNLLLSVRDNYENNRFRADINLLEENLTLNYLIGKLTLGLQYQEVNTQSSGNQYGTRSVMARASRAF
ncbi:MAG: hypothetical protein HY283_07235 [Nitrospirae bacterium]|nr:hypothetical protein [Nitrospirota bacterium]